jgi:polysaccharide biosynthesis protein PslH
MTAAPRAASATSPTPATAPRAVVLISRLPYPLDDGWKVRTFHVVREIAARMPSTVLVFHKGADEAGRAFAAALGPTADVRFVPPPRANSPLRLLLGLVTRTPFYVWNMRDARMDRALAEALAERPHDVGVAVYSYMYPYFERAGFRGRTVVDTHNVDSVLMSRYVSRLRGLPQRLYARATARKLERYESYVFRAADEVWVCSDDEARLLLERGATSRVRVVPNGVDTRALGEASALARPARGRLLFFGKLDYFPNLDALRWLAEEIMPRVRAARPDAELRVVGRGANDEIRALCTGANGMTLVGAVDDVRPELAAAEAVVVPLRVGGGTRLKILEALAAGRPIVSTTIGAEGIALAPGRDILIADDADALAKAALSLLDDADLRERVGDAGQRAVRARYDWHAVGDALAEGLAER